MKIKSVLEYIDKSLQNISKGIFLILLIVATYQVFSRFVLNNSITWGHEVLVYGFIWLIMLGSPCLVRDNSHATITLIVEKLTNKYKFIFVCIAGLISISFLSILFYQGINMIIIQKGTNSPVIGIPLSLVSLSVVVGAFFMVVFYVEKIIEALIRLSSQHKEEDK